MYLLEPDSANTLYVTKNIIIRAARLGVFPLEVENVTALSQVYGVTIGPDIYYDNIGSWVVFNNDGKYVFVPDQVFRMLFDRIDCNQ